MITQPSTQERKSLAPAPLTLIHKQARETRAPQLTRPLASRSRRFRIVHVITRLIRGGADENTLLTCNGQAAFGHDVHLVIGAEFSEAMLGRLDARVHVHPIETLVRDINPIKDISALIAMISLFKDIPPDIVHTHTSKAGVIGRLAAGFSGVRGVIHGVHILPFVNARAASASFYLALEKLCACWTDAFVNVSQGMADIGLRYRIGRPSQHCVVPSGMNVSEFREAEPFSLDELTQRLGHAAVLSPLLVCVAALEPRKRQYEFLDVLVDIRRTLPDAHLALLGEGADEQRLRDKVAALGLEGAVTFVGFSTEVSRWIASASVCVFASEREGLPRAVIQYAMAGAPIVSTHLPGIEAVVKHGETGFLVDVSQLDAMAPPIIQLLTEAKLATKMREAARQLDFSDWETQRMIDKLDELYRSVMAPLEHGPHPANMQLKRKVSR